MAIFARKKDGVPTLLRVAGLLCKYLAKFTPYIIQKYPTNAALLAALAAANGACGILVEELAKVREYGD